MSTEHEGHVHASDTKAAFMGLILGFIALLIIVGSTAWVTNYLYTRDAAAPQAQH
jgi:hypothetical protein